MEAAGAPRKIGLDYLRAGAILCVLAGHTLAQTPLGALGFLGVEIFFVLSGYLIGGILLGLLVQHEHRASWCMIRDFWVRRWLRTLPNYFLFLPMYMMAEQYGLQKPLLLYATFTQNLAWPMGHFFVVSWSLAVEEWFYLLLPLLLAFWFWIFKRHRPAIFATIAMMLVVPVVLRLTTGRGQPFDTTMRKVVIFRLDSLMWGVAMAAIERYRSGLFALLGSWQFPFFGFAGMLLGSAWAGTRYQHHHDFLATTGDALMLTQVSVCCALLLPCCSALLWKGTFINRCANRVSVWSYSMYLSHGLIIWLSGVFCKDPALHRPVTVATAWFMTILLSGLVYNAFERPILQWRDRVTKKLAGHPAV